MKKTIVSCLLLLIGLASLYAFPVLPYTTYDNVLIREWMSFGTASNNVYYNPSLSPYMKIGLSGIPTASGTIGIITPNRTYNILYPSSYALENGLASTLNFIATRNVVDGDLLILEGSPTLSIVIVPGTVSTQNLRLATTSNYTLTSNYQTIGLIYRKGFWKELFHSFNY